MPGTLKKRSLPRQAVGILAPACAAVKGDLVSERRATLEPPAIQLTAAEDLWGTSVRAAWMGGLGDLTVGKALHAAVERLHPSYPEVRVPLVGDGPMRATLEAECQRCRLTDGVLFLWGCARMWAICWPPAIFRPCPRGWCGLGLVVLEAMVMRCPVIATREGRIVELVLGWGAGLLFPPS